METLDPEQIRTLVLLTVFAVTAIEVGIAFLMRTTREAPGGRFDD